MLTEKYISYIANVRRYSPRTQEIYADVLKEFREFSAGYELHDKDLRSEEPAGSQAGLHVDSIASPGIGDIHSDDRHLVESLTPTILRDYEEHLIDEKGLNARTVNQHLSVLSSFCRWLMGQGLLKSNPSGLIKRPKCDKRLPVFFRQDSMADYFKKTEAVADAESLKELQNAAKSIQDGALQSDTALKYLNEAYERRLRRMIISLLYNTGMRRAELISLNIGNVDFRRGTINVHGKGDKMREIPMPASLSEEISLYLKATESIAGRERQSGEPLLIRPDGGRLYPVYVDRSVKTELGHVEGITGRKSPHVLRHTLATELLDDGSDLFSIKELLGHSSLAATQVYTHNTVEKLRKVYLNAHPRAKRGGKNGD